MIAPPTPPLDPEHAAAAAAAARDASTLPGPVAPLDVPNAPAAHRPRHRLGGELGRGGGRVWAGRPPGIPDRLAGADPRVQAEGQRRMSEMTPYRELSASPWCPSTASSSRPDARPPAGSFLQRKRAVGTARSCWRNGCVRGKGRWSRDRSGRSRAHTGTMAIEIEVFADVARPFTHVGPRRFVERWLSG